MCEFPADTTALSELLPTCSTQGVTCPPGSKGLLHKSFVFCYIGYEQMHTDTVVCIIYSKWPICSVAFARIIGWWALMMGVDGCQSDRTCRWILIYDKSYFIIVNFLVYCISANICYCGGNVELINARVQFWPCCSIASSVLLKGPDAPWLMRWLNVAEGPGQVEFCACRSGVYW